MRGLLLDNLLVISSYWAVSHVVACFFAAYGMLPAPIWPAAAIALAAALRLGVRIAPGLYLGALLANAVSLHAPWHTAALIGVMNTLGPLVAVRLIRSQISQEQDLLRSPSGLIAFFVAGVLLHAALTASGGIGALLLSGKIYISQVPFAWFRWWVAHASGTLFFAPVIILWWENHSLRLPRKTNIETLILFCLISSITLLVFMRTPELASAIPGLQFVLIIPLAWAAVRLELRESYTLFCLCLILAQSGTAMGRGPFSIAGHAYPMVVFDLMGISFSVTCLLLSAQAAERRRAENRLRGHNELLEQRVEERTLALKKTNASLEERLYELGQAQETILRKQKDLQKSQTLLNETGRTAKVGGWELDPDTGRMTWTEEVYRIHQVGDNFQPNLERNLEFYSAQSRGILEAAIQRAMETGQMYDLELELYTAQAKQLWVRTIGKVAYENDKPVRLYGTIQDISQRKLAKEALRQSERFNKSIIDSSQDCIKVLDRDGVLKFISPGGRRLLELSNADDILGRSVLDFLEGPERERAEAALREVRRGSRASFQAFMPTAKGTPKWWDVALAPIVDSRGELESILMVSRDNTAAQKAEQELRGSKIMLETRVEERTKELRQEVEMRRSAQEALAESESYVRSVLDSLAAHVAVLDKNTMIVEVNRPWVEFARKNDVRHNPQFLGWNYLEVCRKAAESGVGHAAEALEGIRRVMAGEVKDFVLPYSCRLKDRELWFNLRVTSVSGLEHARYVVAHEDITNVIQAQNALRKSEERYRLLAETMRDVVCLHEADGRFVFASPSARQVFGYDHRQLLGERPHDHIHPEDRPRVKLGTHERILAGKGSVSFTYRWRKPDGQYVWLESIAGSVFGEDGRLENVVSTTRDVSQRVRAEARAEALAKFPEDNPNPVLRVDFQGEIQYANRASTGLLTGLGLQVGDRLPKRIWESIDFLIGQGQGGALEEQVGSLVMRLTVATPPGADYIYIYAEDVTQQKRFQQQQQMVAKVFEKSVEGIIIADSEGVVQMVNRAFSDITGFEAAEVVGREMNVLRADKHLPDFAEELWKGLTEQNQWTGEYWNRRKNGEAYPEWLTLSIIKDEQGRTTNYVAIFHDITEIKRSQEKIRYQAHHDALTGLPNRLLLDDRLAQAIHWAERHQGKVAVLFLDLDNFKRINDTMGHDLGDALLQQAGRRLTRCVREVDTVARLGGDEFIILLTEVDDRGMVVRIAGRLLEAFKRPFIIEGRELAVGISIGITLYPDDGEDAGELIRKADMAMYQVKERGRGDYQLFAQSIQEDAVRKLEYETALRRGLERNQFVLHYQPRVQISSREIVGMEALLRWRSPGKGLVPPEEFLDAAEESGLIVPLGNWVLRTACEQAKQWLDQGLGRRVVSVNLSLKEFEQKDLVGTVRSTLQSVGLPAELLELEITETTVMGDQDAAVDILGRLAGLGVRFALDNFGTGYSSLYSLRQLPIETLKVDRSFVRNLERDPNDRSLVEAVIAMGHTLNLKVVAEGVETKAQAEFLREHQCDQAQGFFFSKPLPSDEMERLLTSVV